MYENMTLPLEREKLLFTISLLMANVGFFYINSIGLFNYPSMVNCVQNFCKLLFIKH